MRIMTPRHPQPLTAAPAARLNPDRPDTPVSLDFDDVYFSVENGLEETRQVYLGACGLPDAWAGRARFTIGELGFGCGLNFLAAWQMWETRRPSETARLHFVSVEGFPFDHAQLTEALSGWPELSKYADALIEKWPGRVRGIHRLEFANGVTLTLCCDPVSEALSQLSLSADAWFLDGFTPAKNPDMWTQDVMQSVFDLSAPGAIVGTFTSAGDVRRGLATAGFEVELLEGYGRKRHRLQARKPGHAPDDKTDIRPVIIGAGIAGASLARSFLLRGITPVIIDADDDSGASGNPAAVVKPRLDLQDRPESRFFLAAYLYARAAYDGPHVISTGIAQLAKDEKSGKRFAKLIAQTVLPSAQISDLDIEARTGHKELSAPHGGLWFGRALTIDPPAMRADWMAGAQSVTGIAAKIERADNDMHVKNEAGQTLASGSHIYICAGANIETLLDGQDLELDKSPGYQRGQVTLCTRPQSLPAPVNYGGYAIPVEEDLLLGATHERSHRYVSSALQDADDAANIEAFKAIGGAPGKIKKSRASVRVTTPDSIPRAGRVAPGISVFTGLGGRGFVHAPLIGETLVSIICDDPLPVAPRILALLDPK